MSRTSLRQTEIKHILKLQELFHNRFLNEELLNELVSLYVKAIGSLSESLSLMKVYFLQKMQFLLSRPEIQRLLTQEQSEKSTRDKYTIKISSLEFEYECDQYVKKSSLHSQPVGKKLTEMSDEEEKIKERENRIRNQLDLLREIELNVNQIPLQKSHRSSNYLPFHNTKQIEFEYPELHFTNIGSQSKKLVRKNSDCFKSKSEIHEINQGKGVIKDHLLNCQKSFNQKANDFDCNLQVQNSTLNGKNYFNERNFKFESFCIDDDKLMREVLSKNESGRQNDSQNDQHFRLIEPYGYVTFACGLKTPQFGESNSESPTKMVHNQFPRPYEDITDSNMMKNQNELADEEDGQIGQLIVEGEQSEKDYREDEYF